MVVPIVVRSGWRGLREHLFIAGVEGVADRGLAGLAWRRAGSRVIE
jgi:hypothetical protein